MFGDCQGRRNRGGARPPSFAKCPFSGSEVPFSCVKNVIKIAFFAQRALLKTWIYVICGKLFSFPGKISYIRKFFCYIRKFFFIFTKKMWYIRKIFLVCPENFLRSTPPPPSVANISGKKFLDALFYWKSAEEASYVLEASYAPGDCTFVF